jgi:hypothetical protein
MNAKRLLFSAMMLVGMVSTSQLRGAMVDIDTFGDILFWAGSGTNQAAFVLEFGNANGDGDTPTAIAWGYSWSGTEKVADMVFALTGSITGSGVPSIASGSDPRLAIDATNFGGALGMAVNSFAYDQIGLSVADGWTQVVREMLTAEDYSVYPALFFHVPTVANSQAWPTVAFTASELGISSEPLVANGWYAFAPTSGDPYPPVPRLFAQPVAAVPEPAGFVLAACGVAGAAAITFRRRRA